MAIINRFGLEGRDDFLGFTFNGRHSSEFRIVRVSQNNAYSETLLPNSRDITTEIVGRDGLYYFGSSFEQRPITIDFAFDDLHEEQFNDMTQWLAAKTEGELTFDERPYKTYMGKINSTPTLNYVCFSETWEEEVGSKTLDMLLGGEDSDESFTSQTINNGRVYKGTGKVQFTCFYPWAYAKYNTAADYSSYNNINDWKDAAHMPANLNGKNTLLGTTHAKYIITYNAGQVDTPFKLMIKVGSDVTGANSASIRFKKGSNTYSAAQAEQIMYLDLNYLKSSVSGQYRYFVIDSELHLILECNGTTLAAPNYTNKVYNYAIVAGDFFKLPNYDAGENGIGRIETTNLDFPNDPVIQYNYRYY